VRYRTLDGAGLSGREACKPARRQTRDSPRHPATGANEQAGPYPAILPSPKQS